MKLNKTALAALAVIGLGMVATQANALTATFTSVLAPGPSAFSTQAGASTIDFDAIAYAPTNAGAVATPTNYSGTAGGVGYSYTGGALYNPIASPIPNISARPVGSLNNYWSIGTSSQQTGPGIATFTAPLSYYGFLWGSTDTFNSVDFYSGPTGSTLVGSVFAPPVPQGTQSKAVYANIFASAGQAFTKIVFNSSNNAFETDNHAVVAIPEPETYAMLLAGLGLIGTIARRRNKSKSV